MQDFSRQEIETAKEWIDLEIAREQAKIVSDEGFIDFVLGVRSREHSIISYLRQCKFKDRGNFIANIKYAYEEARLWSSRLATNPPPNQNDERGRSARRIYVDCLRAILEERNELGIDLNDKAKSPLQRDIGLSTTQVRCLIKHLGLTSAGDELGSRQLADREGGSKGSMSSQLSQSKKKIRRHYGLP
jgi:hypothetical protein